MSSSSWLFDPRRWGATPIRTSNADLERHVAERTGQLVAANMQLTEALAQRTVAQAAQDRLEDGGITLVVSDDGKGYGNAAESGERKEGLGMSIINGLVAQLKATFIVQNANGTRSEIRVAAPTLT